MPYLVIHRSVDGAGLSRDGIPDLDTAKQLADHFQLAADQDGIECSCFGEGCFNCHGEGFIHNPWRYEYVVFDAHGGRAYETRSLT